MSDRRSELIRAFRRSNAEGYGFVKRERGETDDEESSA